MAAERGESELDEDSNSCSGKEETQSKSYNCKTASSTVVKDEIKSEFK